MTKVKKSSTALSSTTLSNHGRVTMAVLATPFFAILVAPVVPDIAVSIAGSAPSGRDTVVRLISIPIVLLFVWGFHRLWKRIQARREPQTVLFPQGIDPCAVLVLPVSARTDYTYRSRETRVSATRSIPEFLIDETKPRTVILVATPQVDKTHLKQFADNIEMDGIKPHSELFTIGTKPHEVITESVSKLPEKIRLALNGNDICYVDTTGGNVPMSLAMLFVANAIRQECIYVSAERDKNTNAIIEGSQIGHRFNPHAVIEATA